MKLTIYWLTIMAILPLFYLWWWKKQWRLILGVIILAIVAAGLFFPGEITYSILAREIEKELQTKTKKTDDIINNAANQKVDSENSEKIEQVKKIVELNKEIKELEEKEDKSQKDWDFFQIQNYLTKIEKKNESDRKKLTWIRKWTQEKVLSALLFCGEEFNDKLASKKYEIGGNEIKSKIATENVIDFANYRSSNPEEIKEKIFDIIKNNPSDYIIWLKNIDQITTPELRQWLLEIFDPQKDSDFWKYKDKDNNKTTPNLLRLIFIVTTSNSNPKYLNEYKQKLHHIEPILDKYFWIIIFSSVGIEIIIFALLIRSKKKTENKAFKKFTY